MGAAEEKSATNNGTNVHSGRARARNQKRLQKKFRYKQDRPTEDGFDLHSAINVIINN